MQERSGSRHRTSLPSRRYALLGPDFHRLDRTSLRLAHSFNHFVGRIEKTQGYIEAERLGRPEIDRQFELGRLDYRQFGRFLASQDSPYVDSHLTPGIAPAGTVADQTATRSEF